MLRSTPTDRRSTTRLEPPYETKGSGIPVSGASPSTAARLITAWAQTSAVRPAASRFPKGSLQRSATRRPAYAKVAYAASSAAAAELLADDREDHVRVRLGQVVDLLDPLAETASEDPAGAEPDQRLHRLE